MFPEEQMTSASIIVDPGRTDSQGTTSMEFTSFGFLPCPTRFLGSIVARAERRGKIGGYESRCSRAPARDIRSSYYVRGNERRFDHVDKAPFRKKIARGSGENSEL
jgi:hypothetical protein